MELNSYAQRYRAHLKAVRPAMYRRLQASQGLAQHLNEIGTQAQEQHDLLIGQLQEQNPPPPEKEGWMARMRYEGWLNRTAEEIVLNGMILLPSEEDAPSLEPFPPATESDAPEIVPTETLPTAL